MGSLRRETVGLLFRGGASAPEGKDPLVREERGSAASSVPVVRPGIAGQPRRRG